MEKADRGARESDEVSMGKIKEAGIEGREGCGKEREREGGKAI